MTLWGSKKNYEEGRDGEEARPSSSTDSNQPARHSEANERTRLLPHQYREGYLDPDDPAVSVIPTGIHVAELTGPGHTVQSFQSSSTEILRSPFLNDHFPMVGSAVRIDFCQSAPNAL